MPNPQDIEKLAKYITKEISEVDVSVVSLENYRHIAQLSLSRLISFNRRGLARCKPSSESFAFYFAHMHVLLIVFQNDSEFLSILHLIVILDILVSSIDKFQQV